MADEDQGRTDTTRGLASAFAEWLQPTELSSQKFFSAHLVALDANVLLNLYEIQATARLEVLGLLKALDARLWIPHQAALEFARNRENVVTRRTTAFVSTRKALRLAPKQATEVLMKSLKELIELRRKSWTARPWEPSAHNLTQEAFNQILSDVMTPALEELAALEDEHDIHPQDMQAADSLLPALDNLFEDRIGSPPSRDVLRSLVDEAISFRYPNNIPPGYEDRGKKTDLDRAGDYILWRQVIEKARELGEPALEVVLITNETKSDWWLLNSGMKILRPRPELAKEMREEAGATFILAKFDDFVENARQVFGVSVSDDTVEQLRSLDSRLDLRALPPAELQLMIQDLLVSMGYSAIVSPYSADGGYDVVVVDGSIRQRRVSIAIKNVRRVEAESIRVAWALSRRTDADTVIVVTTGSFSAGAKSFATEHGIELIDGPQLIFLLKEYLDIDARIVDDTPPPANE